MEAAEAQAQAAAWVANLVELLASELTATLKEAAAALEKALKTAEGRGALLAHPNGVPRLMACLYLERFQEDGREADVVRSASRALAALSMDSAGRQGIIAGASSKDWLLAISQLLRCGDCDVDSTQCASLIVGNLVLRLPLAHPKSSFCRKASRHEARAPWHAQGGIGI